MSQPSGDLPDWQTLTMPQVQSAALTAAPVNSSTQLVGSGSPFRIWGVWLAFRFSSFAAYAAGLGFTDVRISDGFGNTLLWIGAEVEVANQSLSQGLSISLPGFTPRPVTGIWSVKIVVNSIPANTDLSPSGGVYYSMP
jgi:hypothetical protein